MDNEYTGYKDDDGNKIFVGDELRSGYGIPPQGIVGKVYRKRNGRFFVSTPRHNPKTCELKNFIKHLGNVWIIDNKNPLDIAE